MMGWCGPGVGIGEWLLMGLFWLVLLALIVWFLTQLLLSRGRPSAGRQDTPEEILDRRFARGEIDEQTYRAHRAALTETRDPRR